MGRTKQAEKAPEQTAIKKRRGDGLASPEVANASSAKKSFYKSGGKKEEIGAIVARAAFAMKKQPCNSDEEVAERIADYFQHCIDNDCFPMWEELALWLGVVRTTLWYWCNGQNCSPARTEMVRRAKEAMATIDGTLAQKGQIQPVVYIFRSKNFFDMRDQQEVVLTPNNPLGAEADRKALEAKISDIVQEEDVE